jgi:hypothetical protein
LNLISWLMALLGVAVGALAGILLYARCLAAKRRRKAADTPQMAAAARGVVTNDEYEVWKWLRSTFHDHVVMVKLPVLRFTIPLEKDKDKEKNKEKTNACSNCSTASTPPSPSARWMARWWVVSICAASAT